MNINHHVYNSQLPTKFPKVHEAFLNAPWNDTVELIYTSAPGPPGFIWLFGQGVRVNIKHTKCILDNQIIRLADARKSPFFDFFIAFLCVLPNNIKKEANLSIIDGNHVIKSVAQFHPEYFNEQRTARYFLCLVTQIKDMAYMVDEWSSYHRRIGVDHIIIYDNNSTDNLQSMFSNNPDIEIIPWPWKRSQVQAYTHATLFTRTRCVWTLFMDLDSFIFPISSISIRTIIENVTTPFVGQISFKLLRMSHENLVKCPNTTITETYIHRKPLIDAWDKQPFSIALTSLALPLHGIHTAQLSSHYITITLPTTVVYGVHYSDRCWEQYYYQKMDRGSAKDWDWIRSKDLNSSKPHSIWRKKAEKATVKDTAFRDFKRQIDKKPPPKLKLM